MEKLYLSGIRGRILDLIADYLKDRKIFTEVNGNKSTMKYVRAGIPQGGVLAALLFVIFTNDIGYLKLHGQMIMYADDVVIFYEKYDAQKIREDLDKIYNFYKINMLSLNLQKTKLIVHKSQHRQMNTNDIEINVNGNRIEQVEFIKYLGLYVDEKLTWTLHIEKLSIEISKPVGIIYKIRNRLNTDTMRKIYFSLIHSKLNYMLPIWSTATRTQKKPIQVLQNRALKSMYHFPILYSTDSLYTTAAKDRICNINKMAQRILLLLVYQFINNTIHHNITFTIQNTQRTRTSTEVKIFVPKIRTTRYGLEGIKYKSAKIFNELPNEIKITKSYHKYKRKTHEWILSRSN